MLLGKKCSFWTIFAFWSLPQQRRGGTTPPPFHILNFKKFTKSKTWPFLELETRPGRHFLTVFTMFFARASIFTLKNATSKIIKKIIKKSICRWCLAVFGFRPCAKLGPPQGHFWRYLRCFMHIEHSSKKSRFCASGGGTWRLPIAKAKAMPQGCGSICPASDALCIAGFKQASACQPPTREICCIGPGIMDSWEKELYIMLDIMYIYICISKYVYVYFEGLDKNHVMLTSSALTRMVGAARS